MLVEFKNGLAEVMVDSFVKDDHYETGVNIYVVLPNILPYLLTLLILLAI